MPVLQEGFPMEFDANMINSKNDQMNIKVKIKEEPLCSDETLSHIKSECEQATDFHSETVFASYFANHSAKSMGIDCNRMPNKIEIKEEPWSENIPSEIKHEMELSDAADSCLQNVTEEYALQTDESAEEDAPRFHTESLCRISENDKCFFTGSDSGKDSYKKNDCNTLNVSGLRNCNQPQTPGKSKTKDTLHSGVTTCNLTHNCKTLPKHEICEKSFRFLSDPRSHEDINPFKCGICEKKYAKETNLKAHQLTHEEKMPHTCKICNKDFTELLHLKRHILTHKEKRPFTCEICSKSFIRASHLKCHVLTHEGIRLHTCKICNKKFTQGSHLKSHILAHEGKRPYTCEICKKGFTRVYGLKTHKLIHADKRPYECENCKRAFIHKSSLKQHKLTHESRKSLTCEICSKRYTHVSTLKRHKLIHDG